MINRHKLVIKKENKIKSEIEYYYEYKFGNNDCAADVRKCNLYIYISIYLSETENRARHGFGKVYRNSLYKNKV